MMRLLKYYLLMFPVFVYGQKQLELRDKIYEPQIKTVLCYPDQPSENPLLLPASTRLESQNLLLEFDDLQERKNNYYVKLLHCNFDWTRSSLADLDYLRDYNEFPINDFSFSLNTHIPYVHYRFMVPAVRLPGNYVLIIYRDGNKDDLILSRRIMVFDARLDMRQSGGLSGLGNLRSTHQAIDFVVSYSRMEIINPATSVHVNIRQNQRWIQSQTDVPPSAIRDNDSQIEYRFFDMDKTFRAGNEFRFVDFRSLNYPGQNTYKLDKIRKPYELTVALDAPRGSQSYSQYPDMNGGFMIDNQDYRQESWISSQYLNVTFGLKSPQLKGDVYVSGAFNGWDLNEENKMLYEAGMYTRKILLKQGFYNYQYWVAGMADGNEVEGNYYQTENVYEVMVYYRPFQPNADLLIGYFVIPVNPR